MENRPHLSKALAVALALGLPWLGGLAAQTPEPRPAEGAEVFAERIAVTEVQVPVQVLVDGLPVRGLTRESFEIYDRGIRQEILGFEVVDLLVARPAPPEAVPRRPDSERAPLVAPPPPEVRGRQFLLLFDFDFSRRYLLHRALRGAEEMVERQAHPADRIGVAVYGPATGVRLVTGFTTDRRQTARALRFVGAILDGDRERARDELVALSELLQTGGEDGAVDPGALATLSEQIGASAALAVSSPPVLTAVSPLASFGLGPGPVDQAVVDTDDLDPTVGRITGFDDLALEPMVSRIRAFGRAMAELATLLRNLPEPKYLVYLSEGFPTGVLEGDETRTRVLNRVEPLIDAFRSTGWAIHAIDIEGVPVDRGRGVEVSPEDATALSRLYTTGAGPGEPPPTPPLGFDAQALHYLATETGGRLFENFGNLGKATEMLLERTSVTYVLSFEPADLVADGRYHPITVRLANGPAGAEVRHRPGYSAPKPFARQSELERRLDAAELVLGGAVISDFEAALLAVPLPAAGRGGPGLPFFLEIPAAELPGAGGRRQLELEIHAYALDPAGTVEDLLVQGVKLDLDRVGERLDPLGGGGLRFVGRLDPGPGEHRLRVLVREPRSGATHLSTAAVSVARPAAARIVLPPLFVEPRAAAPAWLEVGPAGAGELTRLVLGEGGAVVRALPQIRGGAATSVLIRAYVEGGGDPELSSRVVDAGGATVAGGELADLRRLEDAADGGRRFLASFRPAGLGPGVYRLEVTLRDGDGEATASGPFAVAAN